MKKKQPLLVKNGDEVVFLDERAGIYVGGRVVGFDTRPLTDQKLVRVESPDGMTHIVPWESILVDNILGHLGRL